MPFIKVAIALACALFLSYVLGNIVFESGTFSVRQDFIKEAASTWAKIISLTKLPFANSPIPTPSPSSLSPVPTTSLQVYSSFASCLTQKGLVMYGTKTCPNCAKQKELFGESVSELTLIDCDEDVALCQEKNIRGYPTWEFPDGRMISGVIPLEYFAQQTGCVLSGK